MNFQRYLFLFLRHSWILVLITAACLAAAWAYISKQTPIYSSRAVIEVEAKSANVVNEIKDVQEETVNTAEALNTVVQTLSSNTILIAAAKKTGVAEAWAAENKKGEIGPAEEGELAEHMRDKVSVNLRRLTRLIDITAEDPKPEKAKEIAAAVVEEFLKLQALDRKSVSGNASEFLLEEVNKQKAKLENSEKKLADFRIEKKAVSLDQKQDIIATKLQDLNKQVTDAAGQRAKIEADLEALKRTDPRDVKAMLELTSVAIIPQVAELRKALTDQEADFAAKKEVFLELHPKYREAQSQLNEIRSKLATAVSAAGDVLRQQYKSFVDTEKKLNVLLDQQKAEALDLDKISIPYNVLKREVESDSALYQTLLTRLKETGVTQGLTKNPYRMVENPMLASDPVRPRKMKMLLASLLAGLAASIAVILLIDRLDSSVRTVDDAEAVFGLPVLAAVPESDTSKIPQGGTVMTDDGGSSQAEAFRTLRASISLLGDEENRRILMVTSAIPSEGKTFNSINLAAALATQGLKTLLIDADLRRPALSSTLLDSDERKGEDYRGLTDCLSGLTATADAVRATKVPNLWLLPSGRRAPNPSELLSQRTVPEYISGLLKHFDRVIIDSAPINAVSDSLSLAGHVHAVCMVIRFGKTPKRAIARALSLLRKADARMAGLVMNRMPGGRGGAYYYYYYGDPYLKDSVYGESSASKKKQSKAELKA